MYVGRHEIWPADWVGVGFVVLACAFFALARRLSAPAGCNSPTSGPKPSMDLELRRDL